MILRLNEAEVSGDFQLRLRFNDDTSKTVDVRPLLQGPIFEPLKAPDYFRRARFDSVSGTLVWPNGADFAPEALYALPDLHTRDDASQPKAPLPRETAVRLRSTR